VTSEWLGTLEDRVRDAAEELLRLREENGELRARLQRIEAEEASRSGAAGGDADASAWAGEREAIRQRVERLVGQLEELLED
jgi:hypothetical protein